ncbi:MAG: cytochrome c peroxidase [Pseudomonadales bacterium]
MRLPWGRFAAAGALMLLLAAQAPRAGEFVWQLPDGIAPPPAPADNPITAEKVALGRALFADTRLSINDRTSCATCHVAEREFTDGLPRAVGTLGDRHPRNTPTLWNAGYYVSLTWRDAGLTTLEAQLRIPLTSTSPVEMGYTDALLPRLAADAVLGSLHQQAFGDTPMSLDTLVKALASYVRTLVRMDSPFDRYLLYDERTGVSDRAKAGLKLFFSERLACSHCHAGPHLSGPVHEPGKDVPPVFHRTAVSDTADPMRAPSLRLISRTAPYMHDGSLPDLSAVLDFYEAGGGLNAEHLQAFTLTSDERQALLAFLELL